jgi:alkylated DNA repair dioxygenase AlkB
MQKQTFEGIPGLLVYRDHFSGEECGLLVRQSLELYSRLEEAVGRSGAVERAHIPQPYFVRSAQHNLASEEHYARVVLEESNQRKVRCEYFPRYGEDGHALAYFRGNPNLPDFVLGDLLAQIRQTVEQVGLARADQALTWKLTMNFYKDVGGRVAGFPFHVDIPANGVVTMILSVHREALFQIAKSDAVTDIPLPVGSLLLLSGESRYEWKHRVLPMASTGSAHPSGVERISLVLGFQE